MYMGALGQGSTGSRFRIIAEKGARRISCPPGTSTESSGKLGTGQQYVWCHRAPQFAPPPTTTISYEAPRTTVSVPTAVSTQVSPQISPAMAQQQASPGAQASSAPVAQPGGVTARPTTGITGEDLQRILDAQRAAAAAERDAEERRRSSEIETMRQEMAKRERASQEIYLAEQKATADRAEAARFAREQAEADAQASAATYAPSGGGALPPPQLPPSVVPSTIPDFGPPPSDVRVTQAAPADDTPWGLLLIAAAGLGVVVLMGKKGKRKRR